MLWILTGNFAKRGSQHLHSMFGPLISVSSTGVGRTPVTGAPIVAGLVPSNAIPQEILDSKILPQIPLGRLGCVDDVAQAAVKGVTGEALPGVYELGEIGRASCRERVSSPV